MTRPDDTRRDRPPAGLPGRILRAAAPALAARRAKIARRTRRAVLAAAALLLGVPLLHRSLADGAGDGPSDGQGPRFAPVASVPGDVREQATWLAARVRPDGSFDAASWTGPRAEGLAMHGLALLALARADEDGSHRDALLRGASWLVERQGPGGGFDEGLGARGAAAFGAPVATLALLEVGRVTGEPDVRDAAARAVRSLAVSGGEGAGWAARPPARGAAAERAAWSRLALEEAARQDTDAGRGPAAMLVALRGRGGAGGDRASSLPVALPRLAMGPVPAGGESIGFGPLHVASVSILAALPTPRDGAH